MRSIRASASPDTAATAVSRGTTGRRDQPRPATQRVTLGPCHGSDGVLANSDDSVGLRNSAVTTPFNATPASEARRPGVVTDDTTGVRIV